MFGMGMPEIILILAIALIVIGPKKFPDLARSLGRAIGEFRRAANDFKQSMDVDETVDDAKEALKDIDRDIRETDAHSAPAPDSDDAPEESGESGESEKSGKSGESGESGKSEKIGKNQEESGQKNTQKGLKDE